MLEVSILLPITGLFFMQTKHFFGLSERVPGSFILKKATNIQITLLDYNGKQNDFAKPLQPE